MPSPNERFDRISSGQAYRPPTRALPPHDITIQPGWNVRDISSPASREHIEGLKLAIKTAGYDQTKPISVRYDIKAGETTLVDGQCRLTACQELWTEGLEIYIPCVVTTGDEAALTAESIAGNAQANLTQWEIGEGCRRLQKFGWSIDKIAAHICKTKRYTSESIALSNAPIEAKQLLSSRVVTTGAVLHAVSGKDGDSLDALKAAAIANAPEGVDRVDFYSSTVDGKVNKIASAKVKPIARPKKLSAKETVAKNAPSLLELADAMCRLILDPNVALDELDRAAKSYGKMRGL